MLTTTDPKKETILIIDDQVNNLLTLTHILSKDYTVLASKTGESGLEIARNQQPDLILLDILMPGIDGYEVIKQLKHDNRTHHIPVIFISGLNTTDDEEKGLNFGAADYIGKPFSPAIVQLRVSNQIKMISYIKRIEKFSLTDSLTDLPNRAAIEKYLGETHQRLSLEEGLKSVFIMDIDNFKNFNDTYGHLHGDYVLKHVASVLRHSFQRTTDFVGRWGGEEFIAIVENSSNESCLAIANVVRENMKKFTRRKQDAFFNENITLSLGIYTAVPSDADSTADYVEKADQAMYHAKRTGKDRAVIWTTDMADTVTKKMAKKENPE